MRVNSLLGCTNRLLSTSLAALEEKNANGRLMEANTTPVQLKPTAENEDMQLCTCKSQRANTIKHKIAAQDAYLHLKHKGHSQPKTDLQPPQKR